MAKQDLGKEVWYDPDENGYIGFDVTENIPPQIVQTVDNTPLLPKAEYHCSLIAIRRYTDDREQEQTIADAVKEFLRTHDLQFVCVGDDRYVCRKDDRMTMVVPVEIDGINELQTYIKTLIPDYKSPFLHVTILKSEATEFGIGINSMDDLAQYCEKID